MPFTCWRTDGQADGLRGLTAAFRISFPNTTIILVFIFLSLLSESASSDTTSKAFLFTYLLT
jgi:hypothetical protein